MTADRPLADIADDVLNDELAARQKLRDANNAGDDLACSVQRFLEHPVCRRALNTDRGWDGEWLSANNGLRISDIRALDDAVTLHTKNNSAAS